MQIPKVLDLVYDLVKDFGVELIVAAIIFALGLSANWFRRQINLRGFRKVFGDIARSSNNLFICLPLWQVKKAARDETRFEKIALDGNVYSAYFGPDQTLAYDDVKASQKVTEIFGKFFDESIDIVFDIDRDFEWSDRSGILIGSPIANLCVKNLFYSSDPQQKPLIEFVEQPETAEHHAALGILNKTILFSIGLEFQKDFENGDFSERLRQQFENNGIELPQNVTIQGEEEHDRKVVNGEDGSILYVIKKEDDSLNIYDELFDSAENLEYSVVMRIPNPQCPEGFLFIICGAHSEGTFAAANFLKENWESFKDAESTSAVILKMPKGDYRVAKAIRKHGLSNS